MDLAINQLTAFTDNTFISLENLEVLELMSNKLTETTEKTFEGLKNLQSLNLFFNKISKLHSQSFKMMLELKSLHLGENELENIPPKLLIMNEKLERLILTFNKIKSIDYHLFDNSPSLANVWMDGNKCTDSSMQMLYELNSFKRSTVQCITNHQRMVTDNLKLTLPVQLENDFDEVEKSWKILSEFSETVHGVSQQHINSITLNLNNLASSLEVVVAMDQKSLEAVNILRHRMSSLNFDDKYSQAEKFIARKFIILLGLQITCFILLLITISSIMYGIWKIKQKATSLQI